MSRSFFNPENGLMITLGQIADCVILSLVWFLGCIPLLTTGASCAALYDSVRRTFRLHETNSLGRFLRTFRRDLAASLIPGTLFLAAVFFGCKGMIALWNGAVWGSISWMLFSGTALLAVACVGILSLLFPLLSRFSNPLGVLLKNTLLLSLANMPRILALGLLNSVCAWLCLRFIFPLFFLPALCTLISTWLIEPIFKPYM